MSSLRRVRFEDALEVMRSHALSLPAEPVPLEELAGRMLAVEVRARVDHPAFTNSQMDGYGVRAADAAGGTPQRLVGESRAGAPFGGEVGAGEAVRISTGAELPAGRRRDPAQGGRRGGRRRRDRPGPSGRRPLRAGGGGGRAAGRGAAGGRARGGAPRGGGRRGRRARRGRLLAPAARGDRRERRRGRGTRGDPEGRPGVRLQPARRGRPGPGRGRRGRVVNRWSPTTATRRSRRCARPSTTPIRRRT